MQNPITFAVIGDSAASGVGDSNPEGEYFGWAHHLASAFQEPILYVNVARPGAQSNEVLNEQLPKALSHDPELIAVIVGGNDLLRNNFSPQIFEKNLDATLASIEQSGAISMLLELHDPTQIVRMPRLLARVCRRRVDAVNFVTRKLAQRYGSVLLETRNLESIYGLEKWHVDRMHPSRIGHQFIADNFAHLLRYRGFSVGGVRTISVNNRSRKDSTLWLLRNAVPWFLKRSVDLLPAIILLMLSEAWRDVTGDKQSCEIAVSHQVYELAPAAR